MTSLHADSPSVGLRLKILSKPVTTARSRASGTVDLVVDGDHFHRVVREGLALAKTSLDIATADFKAMLVPQLGSRRAPSIVEVLRRLADRGVEIRLLHAGTPSAPALRELKKSLPAPAR